MVRRETDKTASDIEAISFMASTLEENGKECQAEEKGTSITDLEDNEFKETIKNVRKKLETPVAPAMLLQDEQEQSELGDSW